MTSAVFTSSYFYQFTPFILLRVLRDNSYSYDVVNFALGLSPKKIACYVYVFFLYCCWFNFSFIRNFVYLFLNFYAFIT